jgi:hypothetical protein
MRRDRRNGVSGKARVWGIYINVGRWESEGRILEVIAHELAHLLPWNSEDAHGEEFRRTLRLLVKTHWPGIPAWEEGGDVYDEDDRIAKALDQHLRTQGLQRVA